MQFLLLLRLKCASPLESSLVPMEAIKTETPCFAMRYDEMDGGRSVEQVRRLRYSILGSPHNCLSFRRMAKEHRRERMQGTREEEEGGGWILDGFMRPGEKW